MNMQEIEAWLNSRIGLNFRSGLGRMEQAVKLLSSPDQAYPIIHVTGTNGKGSTIAFMNSLFSQHGKRVGTFTSPHIVSIHDRICISGQAISDEDFLALAREIQTMESQLVKSHNCLSYFEILTLLALLYFRQEQVDLALIEVGIGGLLDTTNVVTGELALITSIGLDHQETLGDSLEAIARQKAGIFKAGKTALIGPLPPAASLICQERARELDMAFYQCGPDFSLLDGYFQSEGFCLSDLSLGLEGAYQAENAALALQAFLLFMKEKNWKVSADLVRQALAETHWAGRLEQVLPRIYLDGAHNLPALERLVEFIKEQDSQQITILFGALKRKDYTGMLGYLTQVLPEVAIKLTTFDYDETVTDQDLPDFDYVSSYQDFLDSFIKNASKEALLFVTGSLYFISEVRGFLRGKKVDD